MESNDLKYWLALKFIDGLGPVGARNLVAAFGSPRAAFEAPAGALAGIFGARAKTANLIKRFNNWNAVDHEIETAEKEKVSILTAGDPLYPRLLLTIDDYPPVLYVKGSLVEDEVVIAVVGSRSASPYGRFTTERLCRDLASNGITVASGMARGIDSAAHRGALAMRGRTIAVLGCGLNIVYPPENRRLYDEIAARGAVITEFPFDTPPLAPHFPMRNRIISGLSLGVVIVEATEKSGSLITARLALDQGREVFAVPGIIESPGSKGTHRLIREGATLVENVYDILAEIRTHVSIAGPPAPPAEQRPASEEPLPPLNRAENTVLSVLSERAVHVDAIIERSGFQAKDVLAVLLSLELIGLIEQQPGKMFIRREL
jgi:DNA processing protein